jgi:hypothetical protein
MLNNSLTPLFFPIGYRTAFQEYSISGRVENTENQLVSGINKLTSLNVAGYL